MSLKRIRRAIRESRYEFTIHALEEIDEEDVQEADVRRCLLHGSLSDELTDDPRGTRFLVRSAMQAPDREIESSLSLPALRSSAYNHCVPSDRIVKMEKDFCEYCNAILPEQERLVSVYRHRQDREYIFKKVPARVCTRCGERYISASAAREMEALMKTAGKPSQCVEVPVIELQPA